jgi:hypothetical protein
MLMVNTYGWEWTTIAALIAPRPLLFANSDNDSIFPMDGNRRIIDRLRQVYAMHGKPELVDDYVSQGGHAYRPDLTLAAFRWMNRHLKNDTGPVADAEFTPLPGPALRVFPEDKDVPGNALNARIDETFVPAAEVKLPNRRDFAAWREGMVQRLRERCFRPYTEHPVEPRALGAYETGRGLSGIETEPWVKVYFTLPSAVSEKDAPGLLLVLNEDESRETLPEWAKPLAKERRLAIVEPRGTGASRWTRKSPPNYVERAHALLGRTVDQGRVWDVAAVLRHLRKQSEWKTQWAVAGRGPAGVIAAYAALLEPSVEEVICVEPTASHRDGPYFLGVLRVLDVPEALGLLAPRRLTLIGAKDKAFDRTAALFEVAGASDRLRRE